MRNSRGIVGSIAALGLVIGLGISQSSAQTTVRVLGGFSNQLQNNEVEKPFFEKLGSALGGRFKVQFRTMDGMGLQGFDALRQLQSGIFDIIAFAPGYVAGDDPFFLGLDLAGLTPEIAMTRKGVDAYRAAFDARLQQRFNGKLLALWPYPGQMIFCKGAVSKIDDLKGKKIRVFNPALATLMEYFGATAVTLAFPEVYEGLQRGVADCAITSSLSGNSVKWFEVTSHLYPLSLSWAIQGHVANLDFWNRLSPGDKEAFQQQFKKMENEMWAVAEDATADGINCNAGRDPCKHGVKARMTVANVTDEDRRRLREAGMKAVLPQWANSCNQKFPACSTTWNSTFGQAIGVTFIK